MKILTLFSILFFLVIKVGLGQKLYNATDFETSFFSEARFENIEATSKKGSSIINLATREVAFKIPVQSFVFDKGLMQEHFNETYMESDRYPFASFTGIIMEEVDLTKEGTYKVTSSGQLSIHGISRNRTIAGEIVVRNRKILITSAFIVPVADHEIDIPTNKLANISQDISVKIRAVYEPKK